jgi:hypothetical protein
VWIVANVGVPPDFQRRGIARQLMQASMDLIAQRGGEAAILQVDEDNDAARNLYRSLGFIEERAWTTWRRQSSIRAPQSRADADVYVRHRRRHEWQDEFALARRIRPSERGGLGWLRPLHANHFHRSFYQRLVDGFNFRSTERLVIYSEGDERLLASLWVEHVFGAASRLTLLVDPLFQGIYDGVLLIPSSTAPGAAR